MVMDLGLVFQNVKINQLYTTGSLNSKNCATVQCCQLMRTVRFMYVKCFEFRLLITGTAEL